MILDIFNHYVVVWMIAGRKSAELAGLFIEKDCIKLNLDFNQLTIHSDWVSAMKAKTMAQLLGSLDINKSFNRPGGVTFFL